MIVCIVSLEGLHDNKNKGADAHSVRLTSLFNSGTELQSAYKMCAQSFYGVSGWLNQLSIRRVILAQVMDFRVMRLSLGLGSVLSGEFA